MISIKHSVMVATLCILFQSSSVNAEFYQQLNKQQIVDEFIVQPEHIKNKIKHDSKQLNNFIKAIHRESAFAQQARQNSLDQQKEIEKQIAIAIRKVLVKALIEDKQKAIVIPDFTNMAKTQYEGNPEEYFSPESIKARHILIGFTESDKQQKKDFLQSLIDKVKIGGDFSELAKKHSIDKGSAVKDGELPKFTKGKMVKAFEEAAFKLREPMQLSPIIETSYGFHVIQLIEYFPKKRMEFSAVKEFIISKMKDEYIENEMKQWRKNIFNSAGTISPILIDESIKAIQAIPEE